jgi:phosphoglycerate dehydrogenase-like enzyme
VFADSAFANDRALIDTFLPPGLFTVAVSESDEDAALTPLLAEATHLVTRARPITAATFAGAPRLQLVQKYGGRPDRIDLDAARGASVTVAACPLAGCIAVAELAVTLVLALSKQLIEAHTDTVTGAYRSLGVEPKETSQRSHAFQWMKLPHLMEVNGKTLGIIGYGEIGTEIGRRAQAFNMRVLYTKRVRLPEEMERQLDVEYRDLDTLLAESDFVALAMPHTAETNKLIDAHALAQMRPSAYLVNVCRGGVVDEDALVAALASGRISGAGLDVFRYEPVPADHPFLALPNVILTPHIGGGTGGARENQLRDVLANVTRHAQGETPRNVIA